MQNSFTDSHYCRSRKKHETDALTVSILFVRLAFRILKRLVKSRRKCTLPYIPGLLSFREAPAVIAALRKLQETPDVILCDGQGIAHPRRLGIASHVGVVTGLATIGCAKSRLTGHYTEPGTRKGSMSPLLDGNERVGTVIRTRDNVRPVFVSVGHLVDLPYAEQVVLTCAIKYRLPEPTRLADQLVNKAR